MTPDRPGVPEVGRPAPGFRTRNQHGESVGVAELRGAPAVLVFYPWAYSGICTSELGALQAEYGRFRKLGARVLAISCDAMFTLRSYADAEHLGFDLLTDHWPHGAIAQAYGVFDDELGCAVRGSFILDAEGVVRWRTVNTIGEARAVADLVAAAVAAGR